MLETKSCLNSLYYLYTKMEVYINCGSWENSQAPTQQPRVIGGTSKLGNQEHIRQPRHTGSAHVSLNCNIKKIVGDLHLICPVLIKQ